MGLRVKRRGILSLIVLGLSFLVGCAEDSIVVAKGRVQFKDGSPLPAGDRQIRFEPDEPTTAKVKRVAQSEIADDGSFELSTLKFHDGVFKGQYIVTFSVQPNQRSSVSLIPQKYTRFAESPIEIDVTGAKDDYLFELEKAK